MSDSRPTALFLSIPRAAKSAGVGLKRMKPAAIAGQIPQHNDRPSADDSASRIERLQGREVNIQKLFEELDARHYASKISSAGFRVEMRELVGSSHTEFYGTTGFFEVGARNSASAFFPRN